MRPTKPGYIPDLLFNMGHDAMLHGLPGGGGSLASENALQELTTAHITTMYYSALANQYLQGALPDDVSVIDKEMPRLKIAVERSYTDFTLAANWLVLNGQDYIAGSPAKQYYDELTAMNDRTIKNIITFYA